MNLAEFAMQNKVTTMVVTFVLLVGGIVSFGGLGRLEDPAFTIKLAVVMTQYPGATPQEVAEEVTDPEGGQEVTERIDDLLDEIDSVLEENAEEFVKNYVQKGGE